MWTYVCMCNIFMQRHYCCCSAARDSTRLNLFIAFLLKQILSNWKNCCAFEFILYNNNRCLYMCIDKDNILISVAFFFFKWVSRYEFDSMSLNYKPITGRVFESLKNFPQCIKHLLSEERKREIEKESYALSFQAWCPASSTNFASIRLFSACQFASEISRNNFAFRSPFDGGSQSICLAKLNFSNLKSH